ncbi:hypothetical protein BC490_03465 [Vibrio parahaemolyticus]|uniref:hypothetical protein n=1 Tax=Vibrio parahaemolyticus TaxID=670 RepID=UPI00038E6797|nr:hypothetical protein [Vibrio parahaemolyticus]RFD48278.1 hypothetical protein H328_012835 [Vibrio parahaemolyticus 3355]EGR0986603.1 hypothetical protein [Vibrio parahaemolyticus]EGR3219686.1 hypothetical protein [Vibrio parahaemolyticus]EIE1273516.1 hypothetical protein [Vibrio parahaemolyticus]EJC6919600.1 hypothetical protein [Vibrio parahaemolyticus]
MSSSWYRRGTVTVTDGSKEVVGVGTLWVDAGNKPLAGDIMFIAGSIYEVESITDNEHLSLFRPFTGVPPANGEYAIIRNTSVTIATRVAAMVAAAINSKQVLLDDLRGYYTSTADKVLIHTDDGSTIEVVPLQTLVSDITNLIAQSESIKNDLANTQAALDLVRQYSNAAQGVEVEPGKYSAKSYAADAADTLALVNKAKSDVDLKASQVQQTKTDIEQFVSTSKTEIDAKATAISKAIDTQATTVKGEITALTSTSKQEITALATQSKKDITTLTTTSKSEINTLVSTSKTEITELATTEKAAISQQSTTAISEMTSLKQSAEQAESTATQKATQATASATSAAQSKTESQALKTQTEALANETKQVAEEIKSGSYVGWQIYCQSEANMKAQRALASNEFAASGFVHYGTGYTNNVNNFIINEGMWTTEAITDQANKVRMGRSVTDGGQRGTSKTPFPVTTIAGFISKLIGINELDKRVAIKFPEAPIGTVVYDSTGNCRGSGKATLDLTKDVDPKYGDVAGSVNEAVARAFEGQVKNGDFRLGTESWRATYGGNAFSVADGVCTLTSGNSRYTGIEQFVNKHITGLKYDFELTVHEASTDAVLVMSFNNEASGNVTVRASELPKTYRISGILAASAGGNCRFYFDSGDTTAETFKVSGFSWKPVSEEVVINRVDMFGFEYFLEEISKANPFVYPYGCIQSKLTSIEGIATKESNRLITYYSVFDGDTTSKGKGVDFWAATDDQKRALVSNPDHNIYLLDDGRLVQWRVRQRTIAGIGNDKWFNLNPAASPNNVYLQFTSSATTTANFVKPQGKREDSQPYALSHDYTQAYGSQSGGNTNKGIFKANHKDLYGVDGQCYFLVCGVVPRLNQGAYHPSFNPMGAKLIKNKADSNHGFWYESTANQLTNVQQAFTLASTVANSGAIGGVSGRPDGKFYDAIYASGQGGVIDYRLSAKDMSSKEEASKIFQKVVNGTYRGEELLTKTKVFGSTQGATYQGVVSGMYKWNASAADFVISDGALGTSGASAPIIGWLVQESKVFPVTYLFQASGSSTTQIYCGQSAWENTKPNGIVQDIVSNKPMYFVQHITTNIPVSGDFTQVDVIGEPANILTTPALANGWIGSWNPKFHTNYNTIVGTRKNVLGAVARRYTDNLGTAWGSDSPAWDSAKNTFVASSLQPTGRVELWEYTAFAKQTKVSTNKKVLNSTEGLGQVHATYHHHVTAGATLVEALLGKVATSASTNARHTYTLQDYLIHEKGCTLDVGPGYLPTHATLDLAKPDAPTPAVKALWYQTANNQQCSLNFAFNELVYKPFTNPIVDTGAQMLRKRGAIYLVNVAGSVLNGRLVIWNGNEASIPVDYTAYYVDANNVIKSKSSNAVSTIQLYTGDGWGDDSTVRIIDGIGTFINLNGDTCLYGTHELAIPYGYTKNKARAGSQVSGVDL